MSHICNRKMKKKKTQSTGYVMKYIRSTHVTLDALEITSFATTELITYLLIDYRCQLKQCVRKEFFQILYKVH